MENPWLTLRITHDQSDTLQLLTIWFQKISVVPISVEEISKDGKKHLHLLFKLHKITKSACMQAFHKKYPTLKGNESISCTVLKKEKENFMFYCCKGTRYTEPKIITYDTDYITLDKIKENYIRYWSDKPEEKDFTLKTKNKKTASKTWSENLLQEIKTAYPDRVWSYTADNLGILIDMTLVALGRNAKNLDKFILKKLVLGQLNALGKGDHISVRALMRHEVFPEVFGFPEI